mgnify:CR=1 FL=1
MASKPFYHILGELYDDQVKFTRFGGMEWGCVSPLHETAYDKNDPNFSTLCPDYNWISRLLLGLYVLTEWIQSFIKFYLELKIYIVIGSNFTIFGFSKLSLIVTFFIIINRNNFGVTTVLVSNISKISNILHISSNIVIYNYFSMRHGVDQLEAG